VTTLRSISGTRADLCQIGRLTPSLETAPREGSAVTSYAGNAKNSIGGRNQCLKNMVPAVATTGFEDFWKGGSEPMILSEKTLCSVGRK
jgi:hypothetical protein